MRYTYNQDTYFEPPTSVLVGRIEDSQIAGNKRTIVTGKTLFGLVGDTSSDRYDDIAVSSWDTLFRPVSLGGEGGLPQLATPLSGEAYVITPSSNFITNQYFNFLTNPTGVGALYTSVQQLTTGNKGHDIEIAARGSYADYSGTTQSVVIQSNGTSGEEADYTNDYRFMAMRGPIMMQSWGYTLDGYPIPNKADSEVSAAAGVFTNINLQEKFIDGFLQKPETWPVAPIDLRYDHNRGVWTIPGGSGGTGSGGGSVTVDISGGLITFRPTGDINGVTSSTVERIDPSTLQPVDESGNPANPGHLFTVNDPGRHYFGEESGNIYGVNSVGHALLDDNGDYQILSLNGISLASDFSIVQVPGTRINIGGDEETNFYGSPLLNQFMSSHGHNIDPRDNLDNYTYYEAGTGDISGEGAQIYDPNNWLRGKPVGYKFKGTLIDGSYSPNAPDEWIATAVLTGDTSSLSPITDFQNFTVLNNGLVPYTGTPDQLLNTGGSVGVSGDTAVLDLTADGDWNIKTIWPTAPDGNDGGGGGGDNDHPQAVATVDSTFTAATTQVTISSVRTYIGLASEPETDPTTVINPHQISCDRPPTDILIAQELYQSWTAFTEYDAGEIVRVLIPSSATLGVYRSNVARPNSVSAFDVAEAANWTFISNDSLDWSIVAVYANCSAYKQYGYGQANGTMANGAGSGSVTNFIGINVEGITSPFVAQKETNQFVKNSQPVLVSRSGEGFPWQVEDIPFNDGRISLIENDTNLDNIGNKYIQSQLVTEPPEGFEPAKFLISGGLWGIYTPSGDRLVALNTGDNNPRTLEELLAHTIEDASLSDDETLVNIKRTNDDKLKFSVPSGVEYIYNGCWITSAVPKADYDAGLIEKSIISILLDDNDTPGEAAVGPTGVAYWSEIDYGYGLGVDKARRGRVIKDQNGDWELIYVSPEERDSPV